MQKLDAGTPLNHYDPLNLFGVWYEPHNPLITIQDDDRRPDVMIRSIQLLRQLESLELGIGFYNGRIGARMIRGRAVRWIVSRANTARHDIAIGNGPQVVTVFGIIDDGHDRDILDAHQRRDLSGCRTRRCNDRISNHDFRCAHGPDYPKAFFVAW